MKWKWVAGTGRASDEWNVECRVGSVLGYRWDECTIGHGDMGTDFQQRIYR